MNRRIKKGILWVGLSFLLVTALVLGSCAEADTGEKDEESEEEEEEEEEPLIDFDKVEIRDGFTVEIFVIVDAEYEVALQVANDVLEDIEAVREGDTLIIRKKPGHEIRRGAGLRVKIVTRALTYLSVDDGSKIVVRGGGDYYSEGIDMDVTVRVAGGSNADLEYFFVDNVDATASGGSRVILSLEGRLDAEVTGDSRIYYHGSPTLGTIKETNGTIERRESGG